MIKTAFRIISTHWFARLVCVAACFVILRPYARLLGQRQAPTGDAGSVPILKVLGRSKRLRILLAEAKSGTKLRITFAPTPEAVGELDQGYTSFFEGQDRNGVTIHINLGLSDKLTENLLAHEIFHIVLFKQGFPNEVNVPLRPQLQETYRGQILSSAVEDLMNCYADAHIDVLMSARGFTPKIINRRQADELIVQGKDPTPQPLDTFAIWRRATALNFYCLSIRQRDFEMNEVFKAWQNSIPTVEADTRELERKVGTNECPDARTCIEAIKRLRSASGFLDGQVTFLNPFTHGWE
jgi:hypothetical protein